MTVPQWALLGFAVWTLLVLFGTVGVYRWSRILTGRVSISEWQADRPQGSDWYQRAMRAHMNCVENLPVFAAIVLCATAAGADSHLLDWLAGAILVGRICQTTVHLALTPSDLAVSIRFAFFFVQAIGMLAMAAFVAISAAG
ncbi:MAPEG family protein [Microvirga sp. BSC39]|uniref:MAPEG family protein n=1 Tax=Microvirga sp. BSC39 TaxID=1549810 RepID=UPI0004E8EDF1|nr:MAPEG family protein [Microvirga sp. BSC39]KFG69666.1 hypothetical protein JH26_08895 [Microvirga sp. BSC39]